MALTACAGSQTRHQAAPAPNVIAENATAQYASRESAKSVSSEDGKYRVMLFSNAYPVPLNEIHTWTVHVETPAGEIVEDAKIYVHGGMPAHRHGFPTTPRVTQYLGGGDYRIEGMKFSMPGEWEIRLNIKQEAKLVRDRLVFNLEL